MISSVIKIDTAALIAVHVDQGSPNIHYFIIALTAAWLKCFKEGHRLSRIFLREARRRHATASSLAGADSYSEYLTEHFEKAAIFTFKRSKVGIWSKLPLNCRLRFTMNTWALLQALITGQPLKKKKKLCSPHLPSPSASPQASQTPLLPLKQAGSHQFSLWPKDTNNQEGLDSNPVFTFVCHTFKGKLCQAYSSQRKCSMEKMRRITVNNML